jgi:MFS family permease
LGDRIDIRHLWSIALFSILIGIIVLANAKGIVAVYVYALLFGGGIGISYVCMSTIISYYFGMLSFTPLMGIVIPVSTITSALAPALAGIIYDRQGSYALAFHGIAGITLLGALLILFARPMISRTRLSATAPDLPVC